MKLTEQQLRRIIREEKALADGLNYYKRKLGMTGRPKPRSV